MQVYSVTVAPRFDEPFTQLFHDKLQAKAYATGVIIGGFDVEDEQDTAQQIRAVLTTDGIPEAYDLAMDLWSVSDVLEFQIVLSEHTL